MVQPRSMGSVESILRGVPPAVEVVFERNRLHCAQGGCPRVASRPAYLRCRFARQSRIHDGGLGGAVMSRFLNPPMKKAPPGCLEIHSLQVVRPPVVSPRRQAWPQQERDVDRQITLSDGVVCLVFLRSFSSGNGCQPAQLARRPCWVDGGEFSGSLRRRPPPADEAGPAGHRPAMEQTRPVRLLSRRVRDGDRRTPVVWRDVDVALVTCQLTQPSAQVRGGCQR